MLKELFGSGSVEKALLFLFINEKGYATQIQSLLKTPLTPIQKALAKLEASGIVRSFFEGKIKMYRLSEDYPLKRELESLLKKAYSHLPTLEKKLYCFVYTPKMSLQSYIQHTRSKKEELLLFWSLLSQKKQLSFSTKSITEQGMITKIGQANVKVTRNVNTLLFEEQGHWIENQKPSGAFANAFRWTLEEMDSKITLEHLRYGHSRPVFLFQLTPTKPFTLEPIDAHLCVSDTYLGSIYWSDSSIEFQWRIIGPSKNDTLIYQYT